MRNMPPRLMAYSILQDERDANTIYLGTNLGVYRSIDRGASWAPIAARKPRHAPQEDAVRRQSVAPSRNRPATRPDDANLKDLAANRGPNQAMTTCAGATGAGARGL
jgi:hypothetical protein